MQITNSYTKHREWRIWKVAQSSVNQSQQNKNKDWAVCLHQNFPFSSQTLYIEGLLLSCPVEYLKQLLMSIQQGRILLDPKHLKSKALRDWIGISYEITDKEVLPALVDTCKTEFHIGIGHLPTTDFQIPFKCNIISTTTKAPLIDWNTSFNKFGVDGSSCILQI